MLRAQLVVFAVFSVAVLISQSAMDFFASILILLVFIDQNSRQRFIRNLKTHGLLVGVGCAWMLVAGLSSIANGLGLRHFFLSVIDFKWILFLMGVTTLWQVTNVSPGTINFFWKAFAACSAFAIGVYFLGFDPIKGPGFRGNPIEGGIRTGGFFSNPMTFAHVYGLIFVTAFGILVSFLNYYFCRTGGEGSGFLLTKKKFHQIRWLVIAMVLAAIALLMSYTRGAWFAIGAGLMVTLFLFGIRWALLGLGVLGGAIALLSLFWHGIRDRILLTFDWGNQYDSERLWIWRANFRMWQDSPWLGFGTNQNKELIIDYYPKVGAPEGLLQDHAHNQFLQQLVSHGILGPILFLIFCGILVFWSYRLFRQWQQLPGKWFELGMVGGGLGAQVALIVGGLAEANFDHSKVRFAIVLIWGFILSRRIEGQNSTGLLYER